VTRYIVEFRVIGHHLFGVEADSPEEARDIFLAEGEQIRYDVEESAVVDVRAYDEDDEDAEE
jgi:hypothetical protein